MIKVLSVDCEVIGAVHSVFPKDADHGCTTRSPLYNYKIELRDKIFNVASTLLIRIDTMNSTTFDSVVVGYSAIKLFCNINREQPRTSSAPNTYINSGMFQLPIYGGKISKLAIMNEKCCQALRMEKLPCASILLRINMAPKTSDGLMVLSKDDYPESEWVSRGVFIPAPSYISGAYDGTMMEPNAQQKKIYLLKATIPEDTIADTITSVFTNVSMTSLPSHITATSPSGYGGGITKSKWFQTLLLPPKEVGSSLLYQYTVPYSFESGVALSIDSLHNMPDVGLLASKDYMYKVINSYNCAYHTMLINIYVFTIPGCIFAHSPSSLLQEPSIHPRHAFHTHCPA
jgi:hypothetical protein